MILVGDWAPGKNTCSWRSRGDVVLANLEGPILPPNHAMVSIPKAGPALFSRELPNTSDRFVFSLANNHMMDYGYPGLEATLKSLDQRGFKACGAGKDVYDARKPILVEDQGVQVGIIACCEAQFGVARHNQPGVAEFGPWVYRAIRDLNKTADAVIVSAHAAIEDAPWPSPYLRELYRSFIDAGATVVHGHHAHIPQGYETFGDGVIFYGMGNFAVDPDKWRNRPNGMWSLAAEIDFNSKPIGFRPLTFEIRQQSGCDVVAIEESNGEERVSRNRYLEICNRPFGDADLFERLWQEVALRAYYHYGAKYMRFPDDSRTASRMPLRSVLSTLRKLLFKSYPSQYDYLLWYHLMACESHRQMLTTALGVLGGEIQDLRTEEIRLLVDEMICGRY